MKLINNKRGFTLVELLLVMAIIGILAGVIFMAISPARKRARVTNFKEQVNSVNTAATLCVDSGGTITEAEPGNTTQSICNNDSDPPVHTIPAMKACSNGAPITQRLEIVSAPDNESYVIRLHCENQSGANGCRGECTIDGCQFYDCEY